MEKLSTWYKVLTDDSYYMIYVDHFMDDFASRDMYCYIIGDDGVVQDPMITTAERIEFLPIDDTQEVEALNNRLYEYIHRNETIYNKPILLDSPDCGCFNCLKVFKPDTIVEWVDSNTTALCPHCGVDSVMPTRNKDTMIGMNSKWFSRIFKTEY
jgi:hypothetical protein